MSELISTRICIVLMCVTKIGHRDF